MCVRVCLYAEPVLRSKDYVRSRIKIGSVVRLYTPVSPSVPPLGGIYATGGILFWGWTFGRLYIPCICSHARWSYRGRFRSLSRIQVPCLSSAIIPLCLLIHIKQSTNQTKSKNNNTPKKQTNKQKTKTSKTKHTLTQKHSLSHTHTHTHTHTHNPPPKKKKKHTHKNNNQQHTATFPNGDTQRAI